LPRGQVGEKFAQIRLASLSMFSFYRGTFVALVSSLVFASALAAPVRVDQVEVELLAQTAQVQPGKSLLVGLRINHDPHWHTYWRNPGDSGLATQLQWRLPAGWVAQPIMWPLPKRIPVGPLANYGFEDDLLLPVQLQVPSDAPLGPITLGATAQWLVCKDVCIPGEAKLELALTVAPVQGAPGAHAKRLEQVVAALPEVVAGRPVAAQWITPAADQALVIPGAPLQARLQAAPNDFEFFPFAEAFIKPPAPQRLVQLPDGRVALLLALAEQQPPPEGVPKRLGGVLRVHQSAFELEAIPVAMAAPAAGWNAALAKSLGEAKIDPTPAGANQSGVGGSILAGKQSAASNPAAAKQFGVVPEAGGGGSIFLVLLAALLGGAILNLMPCVFPVLGLKVMSLAAHAQDRSTVRLQSWWFALGVMLCFLLLALAMLALRSAGQAVGWGFQLQSPVVVSMLALLFVALGLNFFGVFEIGLAATRWAGDQQTNAKGGASGAFFSGLLAAVVATPCTAPFMGSALGFTLDQPPAITLLVFAAIGAGMALPYVVLSYAPKLLAKLPRPGAWMETFKHLLAFPMFLTAIWLAWVLASQNGIDAAAWLAVAAVALAFSLWMYGRNSLLWACVGIVLAAAIVATKALPSSANTSSVSSVELQWAAFDEAQALALQQQGKTVFVDFTAAWCISCQVNKKVVFEATKGREVLGAKHVVLMRADWTRRDEKITAALARLGRNGVPVYLVLAPGKPAKLLPEILTTSLLEAALATP
jgi:thiol:disulfide interchange protein/DsbC/DsbD-like thiol-disulfide interchange protein